MAKARGRVALWRRWWRQRRRGGGRVSGGSSWCSAEAGGPCGSHRHVTGRHPLPPPPRGLLNIVLGAASSFTSVELPVLQEGRGSEVVVVVRGPARREGVVGGAGGGELGCARRGSRRGSGGADGWRGPHRRPLSHPLATTLTSLTTALLLLLYLPLLPAHLLPTLTRTLSIQFLPPHATNGGSNLWRKWSEPALVLDGRGHRPPSVCTPPPALPPHTGPPAPPGRFPTFVIYLDHCPVVHCSQTLAAGGLYRETAWRWQP